MTDRALRESLDQLEATAPDHIIQLVDCVLNAASDRSASDVHFEPTGDIVTIRFRLDGVLQLVAEQSMGVAENIVARLKVLADLLTYRTDSPQEGRIRGAVEKYGAEMRISTFPTIYGERVVVRLFGARHKLMRLDQLGLNNELIELVKHQLAQRTGLFLLTGPSGSGKTTTIYACLRQLANDSSGQMQIATIEDPVEHAIPGVSQTQLRQGSEFGFPEGLRSLLRQDPEVIAVGEIRDRITAAIAVEASLTGHLVLSTVHSGSACGVVSRMLEMEIEPYLITSGLSAVLNQRLVRSLCDQCRIRHQDAWEAAGCDACTGTGYRGRLLVAELMEMSDSLRAVVLRRGDLAEMEKAAGEQKLASISAAAENLVEDGLTTRAELARVLGTP